MPPNSTYVSIISWSCEASLKGKELLVLNDEDLVDMETNINGDVNDVIDENCFISCPPMSKTKGCPKQKRMKVEESWESKRSLVDFVSISAKTSLDVRRRIVVLPQIVQTRKRKQHQQILD